MNNNLVSAHKAADREKNDPLNEKAFAEASRAFNRLRGSAVACLRAAISVYRAEEVFQNTSIFSDLTFSTADTDKGENTALVISGFTGLAQIEAYMASVFHAQGK